MQPPWPGCELPQLECVHPVTHVATNCGGLAEFGNVVVRPNTGRVAREPGAAADSPPAVRCHICVDLCGLEMRDAGGAPAPVDPDGWMIIWHKELLFTDDTAHFQQIAMYSQVQRRQAKAVETIERASVHLQSAVDEARAAVAVASADVRRCQQDVQQSMHLAILTC